MYFAGTHQGTASGDHYIFQAGRQESRRAYETVSGRLKKVDTYERKLVMADGITVSMGYIIQMECGLFWEEE